MKKTGGWSSADSEFWFDQKNDKEPLMSGAPFEYSMSRRQALTLLGTSAIVP